MSDIRTTLRITESVETESANPLDAIRDRLRLALNGESCRRIGLRTNTHPETVRRYLSTGHPSVIFIRAIARSYGISCEWLLLGIGSARPKDIAAEVLRATPLPGLLRCIAERLATAEDQPEAEDKPVGRFRYAPASNMKTARRNASSILNQCTST